MSLLTLSPDADLGGAADPPALLTRFAEELRRAPVAGGGEEIFDFAPHSRDTLTRGFLIICSWKLR